MVEPTTGSEQVEPTAPSQDLLHVLARDHRRFDERCRAFLEAPTRRGERLLRGLATDLLAHEAAEHVLLHPLVAARLPSGRRLASARIEEEEHLERLLLAALARPLASDGFRLAFVAVHRHLVEHTDREELEVFPYLRHVVDRKELRHLGRLYATLLVRIPTRVRVTGGAVDLARLPRRPLLALRDAAYEVLAELGEQPPGGSQVGDADIYAPVRGATVDLTSELTDATS